MKFTKSSYIVQQISVVFLVNIGFVLDGYTAGWSAPMIPKMMDPKETPFPHPITDEQASWSGSILFLGSLASPISAYLANIIGRKPIFVMFGILKILGYCLLAITTNLAMLYSGRFVSSAAVMMNLINSLCYVGEITSPNIRGLMLTSTIVCHSTGALLIFSVGPFVSYHIAQYIPIAIAVVYIVGALFVPESPLFYVMKGNEEAAKKVLIRLGREDDINKQLTVMSQEYKENKTKQNAWRDIFTIKSNRKSLLIITSTIIFQEVSGVMYIGLFATSVFENAASSVPPHLATICIGVTSLVGNLFSPMFVERFGRRVLLMISSTGCCVTTTIMGIYLYLLLWNPVAVSSIAWLPLVTLIIFMFFFNVGLSSIPNTLIGELFNANVRTIGSSAATILSTLVAFGCLTASIYIGISVGSHVVFWFYSVVNILCLLFTIFFIPETKGKTLTEIQEMLTL